MFPSIEAHGKSGLIIAKRIESGNSAMLVEAPGGGGDYGGTRGEDCEVSPRPEVLARLGGGGLSIGGV